MKKQFLFLLSVVTLLLTGCENYSTNNPQPKGPNRGEPRHENPGQPTGPGYQDPTQNNPQGR